jgi:ribosome-associated protein
MPDRDDDLLPQSESGQELAPGVRAPAGALRIQFARGGGPGGQNVNKMNTKAELWVAVDLLTGLSPAAAARLKTLAGRRLTLSGEIHLSGETQRTQEGNRAAVFERLRAMLIEAMVEPKRRRKTRPTKGSQRRRLDTKRRRSETKSQRRGAGEV